MVECYADFQNADAEGLVRLNCNGTISDLSEQRVELRPGLHLRLSDGELRADAIVVAPGDEGVWRASIDWKALVESA